MVRPSYDKSSFSLKQNLHERSPISNLTLINLLNNLRLNLEVSFHIHQSIDLLLYIADLGVTEAAAIWDFLDGCSNIIKTFDKIFFCIDFIAISPSGIIVVESDSTILADDDRLTFVLVAVCQSRFSAVVYFCGQNLVFVFGDWKTDELFGSRGSMEFSGYDSESRLLL